MSTPDGTLPSPNIWQHPAVYEIENNAVDPDRLIEAAIASVLDWTDRDVLDLGCGSGFHLGRFAETARSVVGVEPHPDLVRLAQRRTRRLPQVRVLAGTAQEIPLPDASVDLVHSRWAYFFGPGCEPGLADVRRVVRRHGVHAVIDNDHSRSTFGRWMRASYDQLDAPEVVEAFWSQQGYDRIPVDMRWSFGSRDDLESVVRIEFPAEPAERIIAEHEGTEVDYAVNVWWRRF